MQASRKQLWPKLKRLLRLPFRVATMLWIGKWQQSECPFLHLLQFPCQVTAAFNNLKSLPVAVSNPCCNSFPCPIYIPVKAPIVFTFRLTSFCFCPNINTRPRPYRLYFIQLKHFLTTNWQSTLVSKDSYFHLNQR